MRENWYITNISAGTISLGDLPKLPSIDPGATVNLLAHYGKSEISISSSLAAALDAGVIILDKQLDGVSSTVISTPKSDAVVSVEKEEMDEAIESGLDTKVFDAVSFNTNLTTDPAYKEGLLFYNKENKSLSFYTDEPDITLQIGQELWIIGHNHTGSDFTVGQAVYISGGSGKFPEFNLAQADDLDTAYIVGIATRDIPNVPVEDDSVGFVTVSGIVRGLDTSAWSSGDRLYLSATTAGGLVNVKPDAPNIIVEVGSVVISDSEDGQIHVSPSIIGAEEDVLVKATPTDPTAGYLEDKVDNTTIEVQSNELTTIAGGIAANMDHDDLQNIDGGTVDERYHLAISEYNNLTGGDPTFDTVTLNDAITSDSQAATKGYVDTAVLGVTSFVDPVIQFETQASAVETLGNRYIAYENGVSWVQYYIYEWNGASWDATIPSSGTQAVVESTNAGFDSGTYLYNGTSWILVSTISTHNGLSGLQGGVAGEYYHLTQNVYNDVNLLDTANSLANKQVFQYNSTSGKFENDILKEVTSIITSSDTITVPYGVYIADTSAAAGTVTLTIPDSTADNTGSIMTFNLDDSPLYPVVVQTASSQDIGQVTSQTIYKENHGIKIVSVFSGGTGEWHILSDNRTPYVTESNSITVAQVGTGEAGDVASIEDAITLINSLTGGDVPADDNRYEIKVRPGNYTESNPLTIPSFVTLQGANDEVTKVIASDNNSALFEMSDESQMYDIRLSGPTNDVAALIDGGIEVELVRVAFADADIGIQVDGAGTVATIEQCKFKSSLVTTGLYVTDTAMAQCSNLLSESLTNHLYANGGSIWAQNCGISGGTNGLYANNGGTIYPNLVTCVAVTNAVRANNSSSIIGVSVNSRSSSSGATSTWDVLQEDSSSIDLSSSRFDASKISMADTDQIEISFSSNLSDSEGLVVYERLDVGSPEAGVDSAFGQGHSFTREMLVYTQTAGGAFTDVSTEAASSSGSTFTFPGIALNNAIYVSSDLQDASDYIQFLGMKLAISTAAVPGPGSIVAEYWDGTVGGGSWVEFNHMSSEVASPYTPYANNIFERTGSEQLRFDDLLASGFDWAKNDPPSTGTPRYWVRFRVSSAITTAPIFEQFKLYRSRAEIKRDGVLTLMGKARKRQKLYNVNLNNVHPLVGREPADDNIDFSPTIEFNMVTNEFDNNQIDGFGMSISIPQGLDTSLPLRLIISWTPDVSAAGNVEFEYTYGLLRTGDVLNGANDETTISEIVTGPFTINETQRTTIDYYINEGVPGDDIVFAVSRDATNGNADDTYGGDVVIYSIQMEGYFWR